MDWIHNVRNRSILIRKYAEGWIENLEISQKKNCLVAGFYHLTLAFNPYAIKLSFVEKKNLSSFTD